MGYAAAASAADAEAAVRAAHEAWPAWAALPVAERTEMTLKALEGLDADAAERADILSRENGKVRFEATIDLHVFAGRFHQAAAFSPELDSPEHIAGPPFSTTITKLPVGVVTIIYPFNWPLAILAARGKGAEPRYEADARPTARRAVTTTGQAGRNYAFALRNRSAACALNWSPETGS